MPKFTITNKINNALLEIERARGFLDATIFNNDWIVQMLTVRDKGEVAIKKEIIMEKAIKAGLNERQEKILLYLLEKQKASVDDIRQELDIVRRTVQRDFAVLVDAGLAREVA